MPSIAVVPTVFGALWQAGDDVKRRWEGHISKQCTEIYDTPSEGTGEVDLHGAKEKTFWGDENVLYLNCGSSHMLQNFTKFIEMWI